VAQIQIHRVVRSLSPGNLITPGDGIIFIAPNEDDAIYTCHLSHQQNRFIIAFLKLVRYTVEIPPTPLRKGGYSKSPFLRGI